MYYKVCVNFFWGSWKDVHHCFSSRLTWQSLVVTHFELNPWHSSFHGHLKKEIHFLNICNPLMNHYIFATVHSLMNYTNWIDSCQAYLPVQYALNIELICQKWYWCCDWQRATAELHVQNKLHVFSIGCSCLHCLFCISVLHSNKTVNLWITYYLQNCVFPKL